MRRRGRRGENHDEHAGHSVETFRARFWLSLPLTIPTLIWGDLLRRWLGYTAPAFAGSEYIPAAFGTTAFVYGGAVFVRGAVRELRGRAPGMMTRIALAIGVAFIFSVAVTVGFPLEPAVGVILMSLSIVIVALDAQLLRRASL